MDKLDLFREFRHGVAAPSEDARQRASALLASAIEGPHRRGTAVLRPFRQRRGRTVLALAALAGATAGALFVSTPWKSSPGFLERARAALTPPAGTVLHQKWEWTTSTTDPSCRVTNGPNETWIDQTPPHRYRGLMIWSRDPCASGTPSEGGGTLDTREALLFVPPDTLKSTGLGYFGPPDPVAALRQAISNGRAHDEGTTELDGRTVRRIRVDAPPDCPIAGCEADPEYHYVDPETFYPVQVESPHGYAIPSPGGPLVRFHSVLRWLTYEYLPGTPANRALADIRAQHPNATGP
jgi:hypothetical protein